MDLVCATAMAHQIRSGNTMLIWYIKKPTGLVRLHVGDEYLFHVGLWPEAADTGCPLYVRFREAERTRFARSEFFRV